MLKTIFILFALFLCPLESQAHPHVWVYPDISVAKTANKGTKISVKWKFDEMYSASFILDYDKNNDNKLNSREKQLALIDIEENGVKLFSEFIHFNTKDTKYNSFKITNLDFHLKNETLVYEFDVILHENFNKFDSFGFYDPEYYIGFEQPYDIKIPANCHYELEEDSQTSLYGGMVNPEIYFLNCQE